MSGVSIVPGQTCGGEGIGARARVFDQKTRVLHAVDADPLGRVVRGEGLGELGDGALGAAVEVLLRLADERLVGADQNDRAAALPHRRHAGLDHEEGALEVDADDPVEVRLLRLLEVAAVPDAGV